jgi:hypothetical protein
MSYWEDIKTRDAQIERLHGLLDHLVKIEDSQLSDHNLVLTLMYRASLEQKRKQEKR